MKLAKKDGLPTWTRRSSNNRSTWICFAIAYGPTPSHLLYDHLFGRLKDAKQFIKELPDSTCYRIRTLESVSDLSPCEVLNEMTGIAGRHSQQRS